MLQRALFPQRLPPRHWFFPFTAAEKTYRSFSYMFKLSSNFSTGSASDRKQCNVLLNSASRGFISPTSAFCTGLSTDVVVKLYHNDIGHSVTDSAQLANALDVDCGPNTPPRHALSVSRISRPEPSAAAKRSLPFSRS